MTRRYGPVGTAIWDSEKFNGLASDTHRLGYLYLIACPHGNSLGVFKLPTKYLAADRNMSEQAAAKFLADCEDVGLIETGPDHMVRIIDWFWQETGANNPSTVSSFCRNFKDRRLLKPGVLRTKAIAEMAMASMAKAESWSPETRPFGAMQNDLLELLTGEFRKTPEEIERALRAQPECAPNSIAKTVLDTVCQKVFSTMWAIEDDDESQELGPQINGLIEGTRPGICPKCETKIGYGNCNECRRRKT